MPPDHHQLRDDAEAAMTRYVPRPWSAPTSGQPVVVGVEPAQDPWVVREAASIAKSIGVGLVCAWIDPTHVVAEHEPDGSLDLVPVDSDRDEDADEAPDEALAARLAVTLEPTEVPWRFVYATGEAAHGLREVADECDARLIAVGTHRRGLGFWMNQLIGGSVAGRLAHTQHRPVLVIPGRGHRPAA